MLRSNAGSDYNIPDVPYTMYYSGSYAIHGTYWHHRFGTQSAMAVNVAGSCSLAVQLGLSGHACGRA